MALIKCEECGNPVSSKAKHCPHCGASPGALASLEAALEEGENRKVQSGLGYTADINAASTPQESDGQEGREVPRWQRTVLVTILVLGAASVLLSMFVPELRGTTARPHQVPAAQARFVGIVEQHREQYKAARNELQKSAIRTARRAALQGAFERQEIALSFTDWIGEIATLGTTRDRKAYVAVRLDGSNVVVKTWNNALSDFANSTLIPHESPLYQTLAALEPGSKVRVSGEFLTGSEDYYREASVTEGGSMAEPEFIVRITSIEMR